MTTNELKRRILELLAGAAEPAEADWRLEQHGLDDLLKELQPYDVATIIPDLSREQQLQVLTLLPADIAAEALEHIDHDDQYALLDHVGEATARAILAAMSGDALADLLRAIHPRQAKELLKRVPAEDISGVERLMSYPENTAGGRMTLGYVAVRQEWTAEQAIAHFRKVHTEVELSTYFYVVDRDGILVGVASMRELLLTPPKTAVSESMYTKIVTVRADADQEEAARLIQQYDFVAMPVVDEKGRMVGMLTHDDMVDVIEEEATEDIQRIGGSVPLEEPYLEASLVGLFRKRIGWLLVLFVAESFTGNILRHFEHYLAEVVTLAFFIPLLIDTGGNSGSQASTLVIRALALGEVTIKDFLRVVWREARLGLLLGAVMAVFTFARAYWMEGSINIGLTVALTIAAITLVGTTVGAALPMIGKRLRIDPAVFSAPMITTIADGAGLIIYFQIAKVFLGLGE